MLRSSTNPLVEYTFFTLLARNNNLLGISKLGPASHLFIVSVLQSATKLMEYTWNKKENKYVNGFDSKITSKSEDKMMKIMFK